MREDYFTMMERLLALCLAANDPNHHPFTAGCKIVAEALTDFRRIADAAEKMIAIQVEDEARLAVMREDNRARRDAYDACEIERRARTDARDATAARIADALEKIAAMMTDPVDAGTLPAPVIGEVG